MEFNFAADKIARMTPVNVVCVKVMTNIPTNLSEVIVKVNGAFDIVILV